MPSAHLSLGPTSCPNRVTEHECQGSQARDTNTDSSRRGHPSPQARAATSHMAFCSPLDAAQVWFSRRATGVCTRPALGDTHLQEATGLLMGAWGVAASGLDTPAAPGELHPRLRRAVHSRDKLPSMESQLTSPFPEPPTP